MQAEWSPKSESDADTCERGCVNISKAEVGYIDMWLTSTFVVVQAVELFQRAASNRSKQEFE